MGIIKIFLLCFFIFFSFYTPLYASEEVTIQDQENLSIRQILVRNANKSINQFISSTSDDIINLYKDKTENILGLSTDSAIFEKNFDFNSIIGNIMNRITDN